MAERSHRVEQVGHVTGAGLPSPAANSCGRAVGVADRHDDAPRRQRRDDVERAGKLGRHRHERDAGAPSTTRRSRERRRHGGATGWAPARTGASIGPSRCSPSGTAPGPCGPRGARWRGPSPDAGGHVITVGRNAVTPCARQRGGQLADALRLRRDVDAVGAVDLQVDEPGDDPAAGRVGTAARAPPTIAVLDDEPAGRSDDRSTADDQRTTPSRRRARTSRATRHSCTVRVTPLRRPARSPPSEYLAATRVIGCGPGPHPVLRCSGASGGCHLASGHGPGAGRRSASAAFTAIPEVDLRRWHGADADRAALAAEVRADLPRDRLLPARRPRRAGRVPGPLLRPAAGVLRPPRGRQGARSTRSARRTSGAGSGSAPS